MFDVDDKRAAYAEAMQQLILMLDKLTPVQYEAMHRLPKYVGHALMIIRVHR